VFGKRTAQLWWRAALINLDNLKAAALKDDWFDPEINPKLAELKAALKVWRASSSE
jgi:hypothetical protein